RDPVEGSGRRLGQDARHRPAWPGVRALSQKRHFPTDPSPSPERGFSIQEPHVTTLVLVRHGQASFGARNYDELSATGERQGTVLGEHWRRCGRGFDAAWSGEMVRQKVTA